MTEALGGTVTFDSQINKGTKFIVRLPKKTNGKQAVK
jgi:signal transduction histidine kinase